MIYSAFNIVSTSFLCDLCVSVVNTKGNRMSQDWIVVIGLEVHAELETESKMFSPCPVVDSVTAPPNTAVDHPSHLGMPRDFACHQPTSDGLWHHGPG